MYRDQNSYQGQNSNRGEGSDRDQDSETEAHLPALLENRSLSKLSPVEPLTGETDDYSEPAPRRVSLWPAFDRRALIAAAAAIAIMVAGGAGRALVDLGPLCDFDRRRLCRRP